jgi:hypothetical protein
MFTESGITIGNDSTRVTDLPPSTKQPAAQAVHVNQQEDVDDEKWSWIHHCDEVVRNLPIGLA